MANDPGEKKLKDELEILQSMIDVYSPNLVGLRTQCATSAELTRQEIRTLEGKLIKLFSQQLVTKSKLKNGIAIRMPNIRQWLQVVGLRECSVNTVCKKIFTLEELQEKTEHELRTILGDTPGSTEEVCRLAKALHNLKIYTDFLRSDGNQINPETQDYNLSWDSWDQNDLKMKQSPRINRAQRQARASVPSEENLFNNNHKASGAIAPSPSVSSIISLNSSSPMGGGAAPLTPPGFASNSFNSPKDRGKEKKFPTTPPAIRKQQISNKPALAADSFPLTKSKSHESQLADTKTKYNGDANNFSIRRGRLPTEPGPETMGLTSPVATSPIKSPPYNALLSNDSDDNSFNKYNSRLQVPKSPQTPPMKVSMTHQITHRFMKTFKLTANCDMCGQKIFGKALKCTECKYSCHRECQEKVPASCGLPNGLLKEFIKNYAGTQSTEYGSVCYPPAPKGRNKSNSIVNSLSRIGHRKGSYPSTAFGNIPFQPPDSSSNTSSCNSSTPSSPAVHTSTTPHGSQKQFQFPDIMHTSEPIQEVTIHDSAPVALPSPMKHHHHEIPSGVQLSRNDSNDKSATSQTSNSTLVDSESKTPIRLDSQDSQVSDSDTMMPDTGHMARQNSLSLKEWDIPYDELKITTEVGMGRFGRVFRGYWHGDVAVKLLNVKDDKPLEQFKMEVAMFRKTRHENLILFMGACMKPPKLAIVTSFTKGNTLFTHIHLRKDKFNIHRTTTMAQQICQGMGYLHAKGIIHKDLKTKNIFLENGKVVITDFGLFSVTKLCFGPRTESLCIPPGWLCYLAPELMRGLDAHRFQEKELPFSMASDIYAFGTVWYELLCGEWPFKNQPPEAVIWQVGKGIKQSLANLQASVEVKDILMLCWQFKEEKRPDFQKLSDILGKLPKKKLERSPSHPVHLSRSAESVF
ncbi:kinase suppressor of Ras 2 isoform X2 [Anthonomus grandis grandis]|uniref:kinase suppressor of Ras 2 isoform X2 n=1 Tax=Anthonomus grandis grandis TaxID=2921223 RepID=UPI00216560F5|nr:kinase suppressor of Ras 2 isoform X2 [Anthonomus grandis grandis]